MKFLRLLPLALGLIFEFPLARASEIDAYFTPGLFFHSGSMEENGEGQDGRGVGLSARGGLGLGPIRGGIALEFSAFNGDVDRERNSIGLSGEFGIIETGTRFWSTIFAHSRIDVGANEWEGAGLWFGVTQNLLKPFSIELGYQRFVYDRLNSQLASSDLILESFFIALAFDLNEKMSF